MNTDVHPKAGHTPRWGMVIDLNRCVGCQTCTIACKHANDTTPGVQWRRVIDVEQGTFPDVERFFMVTGCQHCAEPPCVPVCPTGATKQREDGLVTQDYDICIGCAYCAVSCPYNARTIVHEPKGYYSGKVTRQEEATAHPERVGVAQKCTFCKERIDDGLAQGLTPGVDPAATPACAAACISQAIQFGDFNNPVSHVAELLKAQPHLQLNPEVGTDPQIKYLYTTPAIPGRDSDVDDERLSDPANPLVGPRQALWDWRAAMNWIFGGIGSGLAIASVMALWIGAVSKDAMPRILFASAAIVATGLFFVFLKIGRQMRFWRAASRPQTSWMSRELYVALVFFPAVLWSLVDPGKPAFTLAGLAAAGFLACQAKILHRARGIPAWRVDSIPWMLGVTGMAEGFGAFAIATWLLGSSGLAYAAIGVVFGAAANARLWRTYVADMKGNGLPPLARTEISAVTFPLAIIGHLVPILLVLAGWAMPANAVGLTALAGAATIAGGAMWKFAMIVNAGYFHGYNLPKMPQRGSGARAAPPRLDASGVSRP